MNIGQLIKLERQRQNMKQEYLASGICVPSYLSRIENGLVIPSEDIQQHLLKRLNVPLDALNNDGDEAKLSYFKSLFKSVINSRDKQKAKSLYQDVHIYIEEHPFEPNRLTLLVMETRLMLMLPNYANEVLTNVAILEEFKKEMSTDQLFYLSTIQGIISYQNNEFRQASEIFMNIFNLIKSYRMEDWEMAELYYISSLAFLSESRYILAIDYVKSALSYFNQEILIERSIECLVILGIAQKNTGVLKEAIASYEKAREISSKIESSKFKGMIEQNIGACYSLLKESDLALFHFKSSLQANSDPNINVISILSILKEHHKNNDISNALIWLNSGLEILYKLSESNRDFYANHFLVYKTILLNETNSISTFKRVLDYFESKQEFKYCSIYCYVLAKKLAKEKQYKQATIYYEKGFNYHIKQSKVSSWEELS
ncbi:helix-turn-helix transcriptional regulator [Psychrobacillus sp. Sa2BUA9]|uniref:Helix-turn-helix transcriptional regulator n=1 Tax=Psychrobacillus faecigallinarum TaxID=2762235 RepID=A0ABR8REB7_9BACI|nr:helix-turn-helix transcriptional regulator [Psychrobacillus faecigallinarum]MBD7946101.1 helix-turn-helix transcriptional regulator [Psychrobacillus faecigallinarum]